MTQQPTPDDRGARPPDEGDTVLERAVPHSTRTPLFQANGAERYQRQTLIKQIQARSKPWLICYVSGNDCVIDADDAMPFVDLLHNVPPDEDVDLLLHTGGGSIDAAEKLIRMVRGKVGTAAFRIIVPDFAKSAGTLMVLGADSRGDERHVGTRADRPAAAPLRQMAIGTETTLMRTTRTPRRSGTIPATARLRSCLASSTRPLSHCVRWPQSEHGKLPRAYSGMECSVTVATGQRRASELLATTRWLSHGQMISWEDARDPKIGLVVEYLDYHSETWQDYWGLFCLQRLAVGSRQKLYESDYASLVIGPAG